METVSFGQALAALSDTRDKTAKIFTDPRTFFVHVRVPSNVSSELAALQRRVLPPGGKAPDPDHVTLVYTKSPDKDHAPDKVERAVSALHDVAAGVPPLSARVQGWGYFDNVFREGKHATALVALVDAPGLERLHVDMSRTLDGHGIPASDKHVFTPHITIGYLGHRQRVDDLPALDHRFTIDKVHVAARDHHEVPLRGLATGQKAAAAAAAAQVLDVEKATKDNDDFRRVLRTGKVYHGSPIGGLEVLEPRLDMRTGEKAVFLKPEPESAMIYALLPDRSRSNVNYSTHNGKFTSGKVVSPHPLLEEGHLYESDMPKSDVDDVKHSYLSRSPVTPTSSRRVTQEDARKAGWEWEIKKARFTIDKVHVAARDHHEVPLSGKTAASAADLVDEFGRRAKAQGLHFFATAGDHTDGASAFSASGESLGAMAARNARQAHMVWERKNGIDPHHERGLATGQKAAAAAAQVLDVEKATKDNDDFRRVLRTGPHEQLTVMSIPVGGEIGKERHEDADQFVRVEAGQGRLDLDGKQTPLRDGSAFIIPAKTTHNVVNTVNVPLKLYSVYSKPLHEEDAVEKTAYGPNEAAGWTWEQKTAAPQGFLPAIRERGIGTVLEVPLNGKTAAQKAADFAGVRQIEELIRRGELAAAGALAKTPGVVRPTSLGTGLQYLGHGGEGLADLVAHYEHGIPVRKAFYSGRAQGNPQLKAELGPVLNQHPLFAKWHGQTAGPGKGAAPIHFTEWIPGPTPELSMKQRRYLTDEANEIVKPTGYHIGDIKGDNVRYDPALQRHRIIDYSVAPLGEDVVEGSADVSKSFAHMLFGGEAPFLRAVRRNLLGGKVAAAVLDVDKAANKLASLGVLAARTVLFKHAVAAPTARIRGPVAPIGQGSTRSLRAQGTPPHGAMAQGTPSHGVMAHGGVDFGQDTIPGVLPWQAGQGSFVPHTQEMSAVVPRPTAQLSTVAAPVHTTQRPARAMPAVGPHAEALEELRRKYPHGFKLGALGKRAALHAIRAQARR